MNHHDPAGCQLAACQRCDDYGIGYSAGKDKAAFEFEHHDYMAHADDCGCASCKTWVQATAGIVKLMVQVRFEGVGSVDGLKQKLCQDLCKPRPVSSPVRPRGALSADQGRIRRPQRQGAARPAELTMVEQDVMVHGRRGTPAARVSGRGSSVG